MIYNFSRTLGIKDSSSSVTSSSDGKLDKLPLLTRRQKRYHFSLKAFNTSQHFFIFTLHGNTQVIHTAENVTQISLYLNKLI